MLIWQYLRRLRIDLMMNKILAFILVLVLTSAGCRNIPQQDKRIPVAKAGDKILYLDEIPDLFTKEIAPQDSAQVIRNYINNWARNALVFQKAEENLLPDRRADIEKQVEKTRTNLVIYQYQRQIMKEKMDTVLSDNELETYYSDNQESFMLSTNIVKALFVKVPVETPDMNRIRQLTRSGDQEDLQQLESLCYQFAEKFDDFEESWVPFDRITVQLPQEILNEEYFLRRTTFYESTDSVFIYLVSVRDYRLRQSIAPFEYVKDDIKRIIWNTRRLKFLQDLENGIYNDALRENKLIYYKN